MLDEFRPFREQNPIQHLAFDPEGRRLLITGGYVPATLRDLGLETRSAPVVAGIVAARVPLELRDMDLVSTAPTTAPAPAPPPGTPPSNQVSTAKVIDWSGAPTTPALDLHEDGAAGLAFSPEGARVAIVGERGGAIYDASGGQSTVRLEGAKELTQVLFASDGQQVVTVGSGDGGELVVMWDASNGHRLRAIDAGRFVRTIAVARDGKFLFTAGGEGRLFDLQAGRLLDSLPICVYAESAVSPDGRFAACRDNDQAVGIWSFSTGDRVARTGRHDSPINTVAFDPLGGRIMTASSDHSARVWNAVTGEEMVRFSDHGNQVEAAYFTPDGHDAVSTGMDGKVRIWSAESGKTVATLPLEGWGRALAIRSDGGAIGAVDWGGDVRVWRPAASGG